MARVLTNFDIIAAAGAANKAIVQEFTTTATSTGTIGISFTVGTADAPKISGIEIIPATPPAPDFTIRATPGGWPGPNICLHNYSRGCPALASFARAGV